MSAPYREPSPLPADPAPADEPVDIGPLRSSHAPQPDLTSTHRYVSLGLLAVSLGALWFFWNEERGLAAPFVAVALVAVVVAWARRPSRVDLHDRGLVVTRAGKSTTVAFDDVDEVWQELTVNDSSIIGRVAFLSALNLVERNGRRTRVPLDVAGALEIFERIDRACTYPLIADAEAAIDAGETLRFSDVSVTADAVTVGKRSIAWRELKLVRVQANQIALLKSQTVLPWATIAFDAVPHPGLFLRLVRRLAPEIEEDTGFRFGKTG
ncbi:MAG: hypothetical protein HOV80_27905 [Polyangiaceae bacterium]|nr:hypothetical protein [Polyangiaceae bacterium]